MIMMKMDFRILRKSLGSLVLLLVLLSCSKREELISLSASRNSNDVTLYVEGEQGRSIELNQDFLKDFRATSYNEPIKPVLHKDGIGLNVWPYVKKMPKLKNGDIILSHLRLSKGRSHVDLVCHYLYSSRGIPELYGGTGITLIKVSYQDKSYERLDGELILPLVWSQGKLQVK